MSDGDKETNDIKNVTPSIAVLETADTIEINDCIRNVHETYISSFSRSLDFTTKLSFRDIMISVLT